MVRRLWEGSYPRDEGCATHTPHCPVSEEVSFSGKGFVYFMEEMGKFERDLLHMRNVVCGLGR